jgi:cephalosporin hydroxylase
VAVDLHAPAVDYFDRRLRQCLFDTYAGIPLIKFPEDLRTYEHLLWSENVEVVLELGVESGGSTLWFRDRLRVLASYGRIRAPRVIGVDLDISKAHAHLSEIDPGYRDQILLIEGDLLDPALVERVRDCIPQGASCLVIEDSAHTHGTTLGALRGFASLVKPGGFFVVEDGSVDIEEMRLHPDWPRGVLAAIQEWLSTPEGRCFRQRRDLELYGVSCHPGGFLQRSLTGSVEHVAPPMAAPVPSASPHPNGRRYDVLSERALREELADTRERLKRTEAELVAAREFEQRFEQVTGSTSWRLTRPLRELGLRLRALRPGR